ncbi:DUF3787 domain-containing protein [Clostridium oceanicum]|uniref:DUF3787 domain-containing protein n=1 Tax=Clostridium oceanicum TaxID=1543 RepID=A0ABN1JDP7_9CLOT
MSKNKFKNRPKEQNVTAAWADIEKTLPHSKVPVPSENAVIDAKDWVDSNEK